MAEQALTFVVGALAFWLWLFAGWMLAYVVDYLVDRLRGWQAWTLILLPPLALLVLAWLYLRKLRNV